MNVYISFFQNPAASHWWCSGKYSDLQTQLKP